MLKKRPSRFFCRFFAAFSPPEIKKRLSRLRQPRAWRWRAWRWRAWDDLAIRVAEADIDRLPSLLRRVAPARVRRMQAAGRRFHRYLYSGGDGLGYEAFLASLAVRVGTLPAGWRLPAPPEGVSNRTAVDSS